MPSYKYQKGLLYNFVTQQLLLLGICTVKMSVGFALLRIAARRVWKVVIIVVMVFMAAYTVVAFIVSQTKSRPAVLCSVTYTPI